MNDIAIQAGSLGRAFDEMWAVRGLDLEVRRGEIFGLVGPDGAGKTTTMCLLTAVCRQQGCDGGLPYPGRRRKAINEQQLHG